MYIFALASIWLRNYYLSTILCNAIILMYICREIIQGIGHGKAVDWWSVGILLYEVSILMHI